MSFYLILSSTCLLLGCLHIFLFEGSPKLSHFFCKSRTGTKALFFSLKLLLKDKLLLWKPQKWWLRNLMGGVKHTEQNTPGIEIAAEIQEVILTFCILRKLWKNYHLLNAPSASKSRVLLPLPDKPPVSASAYFCGIFTRLQSKGHGPNKSFACWWYGRE